MGYEDDDNLFMGGSIEYYCLVSAARTHLAISTHHHPAVRTYLTTQATYHRS